MLNYITYLICRFYARQKLGVLMGRLRLRKIGLGEIWKLKYNCIFVWVNQPAKSGLIKIR
jgi:hypothetical protein